MHGNSCICTLTPSHKHTTGKGVYENVTLPKWKSQVVIFASQWNHTEEKLILGNGWLAPKLVQKHDKSGGERVNLVKKSECENNQGLCCGSLDFKVLVYNNLCESGTSPTLVNTFSTSTTLNFREICEKTNFNEKKDHSSNIKLTTFWHILTHYFPLWKFPHINFHANLLYFFAYLLKFPHFFKIYSPSQTPWLRYIRKINHLDIPKNTCKISL